MFLLMKCLILLSPSVLFVNRRFGVYSRATDKDFLGQVDPKEVKTNIVFLDERE